MGKFPKYLFDTNFHARHIILCRYILCVLCFVIKKQVNWCDVYVSFNTRFTRCHKWDQTTSRPNSVWKKTRDDSFWTGVFQSHGFIHTWKPDVIRWILESRIIMYSILKNCRLTILINILTCINICINLLRWWFTNAWRLLGQWLGEIIWLAVDHTCWRIAKCGLVWWWAYLKCSIGIPAAFGCISWLPFGTQILYPSCFGAV